MYRITTNGVFSRLHRFNFDDGYYPVAPLIEASDGLLYGTTSGGGANDTGTILRLATTGKSFVSLHSFAGLEGCAPDGALVQGRDGNFHGTNEAGGATDGTVYRFSLTPVITSAGMASATVGKAFSYQITATDGPTSYGAAGLPAGLSLNVNTGLISGTPANTAVGTKTITLKATNSVGTGTKTLTLTITK